jgi:hypothetical protein
MADNIREHARWRREKTPIITKYLDDHTKLFSEIAGRGFSRLPGYAYDLENQLETMTKMGLSELNQKILAETIDRELKQSGIDYDLAYRNALLTWEIEKQALLTAWGAEYQGIQQQMANDEEALNRLATEVSRRAIALLEAKTAIELDMEAQRKALAVLDGATASYEVQLANAKLMTAQKKLEIIPIIQEIITKEQELLVIEQGKAAAYALYITAEQEVATKKETLTPFINDLATRAEEYASKITSNEIPIEQQIAAEKLTQAGISVQKSVLQTEELTTEIEIQNKNLGLMDKKRTLQETQFGYEQTLLEKETALSILYQNDEEDVFDTLIQEERDTTTNIIANRTTAYNTKKTTAVRSATTIANAKKSEDDTTTNAQEYKIQTTATYEAAAKITADLTHLIGD